MRGTRSISRFRGRTARGRHCRARSASAPTAALRHAAPEGTTVSAGQGDCDSTGALTVGLCAVVVSGYRLTYIEPQCIRLLRMDMSKDLVAASATPLVLAILAEGDSYGYAIIKRVAELSGGHLQWTDGMLYPVLHRLERQGHIAAKWSAAENGRRRKYYRITKEGRAQLAAHREQWKAVDGTLRGIWMKACTV